MIRIKKYISICLLIISSIVILNTKVLAATVGSYDIKVSTNSIFVGEKSNLTIAVSNCEGLFTIKSSNSDVISVSSSSEWIDSSKTITLTAKTSGTAIITITPENVADNQPEPEDVTGAKTVTVTVNEKPVTPTPEQPTTPEPQPETLPVEQKPEFKDTNKTMYASKDINLRASWSTESAATSIGEGTELTVTATSSNKVNGYVWYRVTYNGKTLYVASNLLTDKKPEKAEEPEQPIEQPPVEETPTIEEPQTVDTDKDEIDIVKDGLQSLQIEGVTLSPTFSPEVYEYRTVVKENISELVINAVPAVEGATVTIAENTNLAEGENLITIVVYNAEGNVEATYQVTVNKNTLDLSETDNMLKLGTKTARRNLIIFIAILVVALIALIVVMILRRKNQSDEEEFTNNEENVENNQEVGEKVEQELTINEKNVEEIVAEKEQVNEEENQEEAQRPRRDKRKGKHF